jgi:glutamate-1-semialdehyde 2,1-aminomutase
MNRQRSALLFERAKKVLVGGVNSPVRSFRRVGGSAVLAKSGSGASLIDVDGNSYIDFVMSYGPHLFGHAQPRIIQAVQSALPHSSCLGLTSEGEIEWAELLLKRLPGAEKVRALSTGTEATSAAIRLARGITGRSVIVKMAGHYHGHVDSLLVDGGSGLATLNETTAVADSKGLPEALTQLSRVVEFNNIESLRTLFSKEGSTIAGVILEPIMGNMGVVPPKIEFLKSLRELCSRHGALLIFDEVMTGLRVHRNSAQGLYNIQPDITCLGKIVGGGLPLAALAGPAKYMDFLAPLGPVYQAGTLSGNPICVAAGIAMLKLIDEQGPYDLLETIGKKMESTFYEVASDHKVDLRIERVGSMISPYFRSSTVFNANDCKDVNYNQFNTYFWSMLDAGYMLPPSPFEACFLSTVHLERIESSQFKMDLGAVFKKISQTN